MYICSHFFDRKKKEVGHPSRPIEYSKKKVDIANSFYDYR
jgi:hypothetical protein